MQCPECQSTHIRKNGNRRGQQNHLCVDCSRQFIDHYTLLQGYSDEIKRACLNMSVNGMGFRAIERVKGVHHTTMIYWLKQVGERLPEAYDPQVAPPVGELAALETLVGSKKTKSWLWTAVDHFKPGILGWVVGDPSAATFQPLWAIVQLWQGYFQVTHGWSVQPGFIPDGEQIVSKTDMTASKVKTHGDGIIQRDCIAKPCVMPKPK